MAPARPLAPDRTPIERRARQPLLYGPAQLLGREPIRLRRQADRRRLAAHLAVVVSLVALTVWWIVPLHWFAGPVLLTLTRHHGVHAGDLPVFVFLMLACRSAGRARRLAVAR